VTRFKCSDKTKGSIELQTYRQQRRAVDYLLHDDAARCQI